MKIQIFRSGLSAANWYFRILAKNGKIIAQSEGYKSRKGAIKTAKLFNFEIVFL
jgi:uncharacterized protein YegP (UPF0339 family)